jgi:Reverse transcriptase (RNA-dependent DNA polymerase)/gag-polypeptide of LTR copia-type/GAG-pre-integrase domain
MSTSSSTLSLIALSENDKLRGYENYISWKTLMEAHGKPKGLHKYWGNEITIPKPTPSISDTPSTPSTAPSTATSIPTPVHSTKPSELEYELRESVALSSILINVVDISGSGLNPSGTSHEAWKLLLDQYGKTSDRARNMREEALASCKLIEGGKVAGEGGHIEKMRTLRKLANDTGADIQDSRFITKLLDSFPESWDAVITPMYSETNLSTVIMNLTTHAERLAIRDARTKPELSVDTVKALETTIMALQTEMKSLKSNPSRGTPNPNKAHLKCSNTVYCGKTGHLIEDCFQQGGGKAGQYPPWWKGKRSQTPSVPSANLATSSIADGAVTTGSHYALSASFNIKDIEQVIAQNIPVERKIALAVAENPKTLDMGSACVADSGCTTYFFKSREAFSSYTALEKAAGQSSKEGTNFTVLGMGTVQIKVVHNGLEHTLTFGNALHAPDVTANLISISRLDLAGWDIVFGGGKARFFKDKKEIFGGILKNGLYLIGGSFISNIPTALTARSLRSPGDIALWHRRFGHFGIDRILEASKSVNGLEITTKDIIGKCEDCIIGNQKRRPYDEGIIPETKVLRLTNIDFWGPARVQSTGGSYYALKFHDSGSSRRRSFFLKDRTAEAAVNSLTIYKSQSENITGEKMVYIRTDNAREFLGELWMNFCNKNGIIMVPTAPYSSGSNGTAERSIGITTGSVRIMLNDAKLSARWWAEAWAYSEMVENLLPSTRHPGVIPEEKFTGLKQDVGHIRVWGCIAFVYIPKEKNGGKLGDRGQKGRLMGMEGRGLYRVLIPETGQIIRSRNVVFEEGFGHRTLTDEGEYFADDEGNVDSNFENLTEDTVINVPQTSETSSETIQTDPSSTNKPKVSRPRIIYPPASRKSTRLQMSSNATEDSTTPIIDQDDEEETQIALTANIPHEPLNKFVPSSFAEAFDITRRHLWMPAMEKEIERWDNRGVVTAVPRPKGVKTIKGKWVFDLKVDGDGNLLRRRARGVVKGFTQKFGEHWWDSFAAVVRYESIRMLFALIASKLERPRNMAYRLRWSIS